MGFAEKRTDKHGSYFRARYKNAAGKYGIIKDSAGATFRFAKKRDAEKAANDEEAKIRARTWKDPALGRGLFGGFANTWYAGQDLAPSTMQNYKRHLEQHILPEFEDTPIGDILDVDVEAWEQKEKAAGYKPASVKTWRTTLHTVLEDAVYAGIIDRNPATKRRGKGRRAGRSQHRGPEKPVITALEALLLAERAALLSGRPDEFVLVTTKFYTGARWAELVGLEQQYARLRSLRIERQLYELDTGELVDCPPKDDSYRDVDLPGFLSALISGHIARTNPQPCSCHGLRFVFSGGHEGTPRNGASAPVTMAAVAEKASVSTGTVSTLLNHPERVAERTRARIEEAITELGYVRSIAAPRRRAGAAHWRRSGFAAWVFTPATSGWFPPKAPQPRRPVPVCADPWPGVPVRGRNSQGRADFCWSAISPDLTPHLLRHSARTLMDELRTPDKLKLERLGHEMGGIEGRYSHATPKMRAELMGQLTEIWHEALDARWDLHQGSPVSVLDEVLKARQKAKSDEENKIFSPDSPQSPEIQKARLSLVRENRA